MKLIKLLWKSRNRHAAKPEVVRFYPLCDDDYTASEKIYQVARQISLMNPDCRINCALWKTIFSNIEAVLNYWTGSTYVGERKSTSIESAFQQFFEALYCFIRNCKTSRYHKCREFSRKALYQGALYRYLGHSEPSDSRKRVHPQYNKIYVSWSKNEENEYLESKLYGVKTLLACNVNYPYFGIDLSAFGMSRGNEREVVFPTIEETMTRIKFIKENDDE